MTLTAVSTRVVAPVGSDRGVRLPSRHLPAHWPLTVLLVPYPLWWLLGLDTVMPLLLVVPMAVQLLRRPHVHLAPGFGWWMLFLLWVVLGVVLLWSDAPGAVPGADSSRVLVFTFRLAWYVACTVVFLWVSNLGRDLLPDQAVLRLVGWIFVVSTAGGLLGLLAPTFEIRSALEMLLPRGIGHNPFVASLVHPQAADVQMVLGHPEPRPKAPFPFTNTWGSCLSLSLVFLVAVDLRGRRLARAAVAVVMVVALVPIVYSLNRGLWASLAVGLLGLLLLRLVRGDRAAFIALVAASVIGIAILAATPLADLYGQRIENQHSNDRRGQLLSVTTASVTTGSPVLGFGSTRDVQGSFASITGAATPECPACGVPPLGTQGQLWLVLFSQGWLGLAFFLLFVALSLARSWRCRTTVQTVCTFAVVFFVIQLPIYDTLGLPLYLVMIAVALAAREQRHEGRPGHLTGGRFPHHLVSGPRSWRPTSGSPLRAISWLLALLLAPALVGGVIGATIAQLSTHTTYRSTVWILIAPAPVHLDAGARPDLVTGTPTPAAKVREITVDTEAGLLLSRRTLSPVGRAADLSVSELRSMLAVTAAPSSQVLVLTMTTPVRADATSGAREVAASYLRSRETFVTQRRAALVAQLRDELDALDPLVLSLEQTRAYLVGEIDSLRSDTDPTGEVIRQVDAAPVRQQREIPIASGAALGLLIGIAAARHRAHRRAVRTARPHSSP